MPVQCHHLVGAVGLPMLCAQFIYTADAGTLDVECWDKLAYTSPFMSLTGGGHEAGIGDSGFGIGCRPERIRFPDRPSAFPNPQSPIPNPMIVAEHLRKTFPGKGRDKTPVVAVDDVGFEARDGEITGLDRKSVV